ncbi:MAG: ATP-binding cassette domain-containing protein, partial [Patescibacteria group bacterium]
SGKIVELHGATVIKNHKAVEKKLDLVVRKDMHVVIAGPNGIGKSTLLAKLATGSTNHGTVAPEAVVGYYQQDFGNLDSEQVAYDVLKDAMFERDEQKLRSAAAGFLLDGHILSRQVKALSEGQKGLLSFCRLVLLKPGLLILDEPTNHINFRHLPILAQALDEYQGAMIMVSHIPEFVAQIRVDTTIDLGTLKG